jgi:ribosome-associated protein
MANNPASTEQTIQLDQFLKWKGLVSTGGQAKLVIQGGDVQLNGVIETRRKKKLKAGDKVTFEGRTFVVDF